ncbi:DrmB family protein [Actinomadura chokoriensis]|uniref:DUF1998 domain-containing protein n=1 Tax=Actinomadura chokoriensis TaxID=454156 RepID=A0ABV4QW62_9ACTN
MRRAQLITTYGVGSIVAVESESFMVAGIDRWPDLGSTEGLIKEPLLERKLRVDGFRLPPAFDRDGYGDVPVVRFPQYQSCPSCNRLDKARAFGVSRGPAKCKSCERDLVPSRFVMCCPKGHIDDFPYYNWVHQSNRGRHVDRHAMRIESTGRSAALRDIVISCDCGARMTLEGALGRYALKGITSCTGLHPWLDGTITEACEEDPRAMQRGASGVWFSDVVSAISIPPWSEPLQSLISRHWEILAHLEGATLRKVIETTRIGRRTSFTTDDIVLAVEKRQQQERGLQDDSAVDIRAEEYKALNRTVEESTDKQKFVCVPAIEEELDPTLAIDKVMKVKRLREVRVLKSFTRLEAPSPVTETRPPLYTNDPGWLPAIEVIGEGVFLRLDQKMLAAWEQHPEVIGRAAETDIAYRKQFEQYDIAVDREITPRLMMVHTLAHAVINEWALDCGYSAASLRERLYVSDSMAGILIYTATSDSAGSLGGIVAQAEFGDLSGSIRRALNRMTWCSSDPLCIESPPSGPGNLNHAACHACVLLPETSCEEFNTFLDRALLVGTPGQPELGFFAADLSAAGAEPVT